MRIKIKRKSISNVEQQILTNKLLISNIKDTMNYLEPELCNEAILSKLVVAITPIVDTDLLKGLNDLLNTFGESKLNEVKELYELFFNETETPNNN